MVPYRESFIAERVDQAAVADCIRRVKAESGYLLDPHSACAVVAARKTMTSQSQHVPHIALATAHPAKFPDAMQAITGERPALPPRLASLMSRPGAHRRACPTISAAVERFVESGARANKQRSRRMSTQLTRLPNGLRVVSHHMPHVETVSLGVWVAAGARHEREAEHGISHLLEHMAFKGTERRSASDIAEEIEAVGGELNAATSLETTAYFARMLKADIGIALDILADILQIPRYAQDELEREREVILQEIAATRDSPDEIAYELLQDAAFPDQAIGRPILGTTQSVTSFGADDLRTFLKANYGASRMVLSAAGNVDHAELVRHAEAQFGGLNGGVGGRFEPARYVGWHAHVGKAVRAEPSRHGVCRAVLSRRRSSTPPRCSRGCSAGACRRGCSRRCGSAAASATRSIRAAGRWPIRACSASTRRPGRR